MEADMTRRNWLTGAIGALIILSAAGAYFLSQNPSLADSRAMMLPVDPTPLIAITSSSDRSFTIEVADEPSERSAGLMFRETMPDDRGMLFVFEGPQDVNFWMKNTPMPLDLIAYRTRRQDTRHKAGRAAIRGCDLSRRTGPFCFRAEGGHGGQGRHR